MAEVLKASAWWRNVQNTGPNVATHPNATLDAQAARLMSARHSVLQLDLAIQDVNHKFKATIEDMEKHYHGELDRLESEFQARSADLSAKYRTAHEALMREQKGMAEMLKGVDCKAEFINHFPVPKGEGEPQT